MCFMTRWYLEKSSQTPTSRPTPSNAPDLSIKACPSSGSTRCDAKGSFNYWFNYLALMTLFIWCDLQCIAFEQITDPSSRLCFCVESQILERVFSLAGRASYVLYFLQMRMPPSESSPQPVICKEGWSLGTNRGVSCRRRGRVKERASRRVSRWVCVESGGKGEVSDREHFRNTQPYL